MLSDTEIEYFVRDGFVLIEGGVPTALAEECAELLWAAIDPVRDDPKTWRNPVEWVGGLTDEAFTAAANQPALTEAFDQLVGAGRWRPRRGMGSFPIRFPHAVEPDDAGWHIEGSYESPRGPGYWTNVRSRDRVLLMLFLFSEVDEAQAPTRIRVGSHHDVPRVLAPYGEAGASAFTIGPLVDRASVERPTVLATGAPGDVYLCHPFLVHAAQPHHGGRPRLLGQPPLAPAEQLRLDRGDGDYSIVEATIRTALAS
ncbi:MAG TPA: phytanoyl-CoA dioxygenase family protein [Nocardioides sp.]|uniref:phytanoyl-CoA dioxygenase family protein n=1 Tax=Nocardioides sp. TaxID=35761 RepID=UPI002E2F173C|nr:phytanoyl-CoA dioxygenase family protein [Nocardioides sp.]HEX3932285.1 phytanoyl-CoA dioxygenase family protein [Nocardioides sp.]